MKIKLSITIMTFITALFFSACGGGGDDGHFRNADSKITIVDCNVSNTTVLDYTPMLSGDVLVNQTDNTSVETYHDINGTKKVCTVSGVAYLIRK